MNKTLLLFAFSLTTPIIGKCDPISTDTVTANLVTRFDQKNTSSLAVSCLPEGGNDDTTSTTQVAGVSVTYRIIPMWVEKEDSPPAPRDIAPILHLISSLSPHEMSDLKSPQGLRLVVPAQKQYVNDFFTLNIPSDPNSKSSPVRSVLGSSSLRLTLKLLPLVINYSKDEVLGQIRVQEKEIKASKSLEVWRSSGGVPAWFPDFTYIEPRVELALSPRTAVTIAKSEVASLAEIAKLVSSATGKVITTQKDVENSRFLITKGTWDSYALLKAVTIVTGTEVRKIGDEFYWDKSPTHLLYTQNLDDYTSQVRANEQLLSLMSSSESFFSPFKASDYAQFLPKKVDALTQPQKDIVFSTKNGFRSKVIFIRCVAKLSVSVISDTASGDQPSAVTVGVYLTNSPPSAPILKPISSEWKMDTTAFYLQQMGAVVRFKENPK